MSRIVAGDPPSDCHPKIRDFLNYWVSIHPTEGLPGRQHLEPTDIPALLPNIFMVDILETSADFMFRLMGTRLKEFFGGDFTGKPFVSAFVKAR